MSGFGGDIAEFCRCDRPLAIARLPSVLPRRAWRRLAPLGLVAALVAVLSASAARASPADALKAPAPYALPRSALTLSLSTLPFGVVEARFEHPIDEDGWWAIIAGGGMVPLAGPLSELIPLPLGRSLQEIAAQVGYRLAGDSHDSLSIGTEALVMRIGPRPGRSLDLGLAGGPVLSWMVQSRRGLTCLLQVVGGAVLRRVTLVGGDTATTTALHGLVRVAVGYAW